VDIKKLAKEVSFRENEKISKDYTGESLKIKVS
jgi:hypothetical protein